MPWISSAVHLNLLTKAARVDALVAETERLILGIKELKEERADLLNRLLEKQQIRPLSEPMPAHKPPEFASIPIISPFGAVDKETEDAAREAWVSDLAEGYVEDQKVDADTARQMALQEYTRRYTPIN